MIVYIVKGNTGEYGDREDWVVRAFFNKETADDLKGGLNILVENSGRNMCYEDRENLRDKIRETLDPNCEIDYTGTYYTIESIEVE
jgi:hypothetical protein